MNNHKEALEKYSFEAAAEIVAEFSYKGVTEPLARQMYEWARQVGAEQAIVEIGCFVGCSTIFLGYGALSGKGTRLYCIDPWGLPASTEYSQNAYQPVDEVALQ